MIYRLLQRERNGKTEATVSVETVSAEDR